MLSRESVHTPCLPYEVAGQARPWKRYDGLFDAQPPGNARCETLVFGAVWLVNGYGADRTALQLSGDSGDPPRVESAGQEHVDRPVARKVFSDGIAYELAACLDRVLLRKLPLNGNGGGVPVMVERHLSVSVR